MGHSPSEPYLTNYHYILGASFKIRLLTLGERADYLYSRTSTNTDVLKFSDNSTLEYSTDHGIYIAAGDTLCFHKREWEEYPYGLNEFRITDSEGNVYKCKSSGSTGKNALEMNIYYADGSKYSGDVITDFIEDYHVGLELYKKMKAFTKSSIKYYKGTYTDTRGATTEYIDGETKANHDARLLADAKAKEEAEQEAKRKDEQARIAAHNELVRKYGKTFAEAIENDHIMVGMTTEMLNKMTLDWSLYYDGGSKKIYIGEQNMLADAFIKTFGGRSKKAYVTVVNNKVQSIVYK